MFCITGYHSESLNILPYRLPQLTFRYSTLWPMGYLIYSSYTLPYSYLSLLYSTVDTYAYRGYPFDVKICGVSGIGFMALFAYYSCVG